MFRSQSRKAMLLLLAVVVLLAGCTARKPAPKPAPQIDEPTILLFVNETGEKKNIKIEDYLQGVVAAEMNTEWPVNALAAQAIIARTFTMENIAAGRIKELRGTDASTSVEEFQAYAPQKINDNVRRAVELTRGEVVVHQGRYVKAWFSACDGGVVASPEEGLAYTKEPVPYIRAGAKDNCLTITVPENKAWEARIPLGQVRNAVRNVTGQDPGPINSASIEEKGPSGRAVKLKIGNATVGGPALRLALGSERVRSMLLTDVRVAGGHLILAGQGYGHGVGMCQWGAKLMAEQGKSPEEIVEFYYKDVNIEQRWK